MCICVPFNDVHFTLQSMHFTFSSGLSFCGTVKDHNFQLCYFLVGKRQSFDISLLSTQSSVFLQYNNVLEGNV